jgi:hypothetical protein
MAEADRKMRLALKKLLVPVMEKSNFNGMFPHFRRKIENELQLVTVLFWKYGGSFCLEFGRHPAGDRRMPWGDVIAEEKLEVVYVPLLERRRLQAVAGDHSLAEHWFAYENIDPDDAKSFVLLAHKVSHLFSQVDDWFRDGTVGPNLHPNGGRG